MARFWQTHSISGVTIGASFAAPRNKYGETNKSIGKNMSLKHK